MQHKMMMLCDDEWMFYQQKAKCRHLKHNDKCTKFFHDMVRNYIAAAYKANGLRTQSQQKLAVEFMDFYTSLLGLASPSMGFEQWVMATGTLIT